MAWGLEASQPEMFEEGLLVPGLGPVGVRPGRPPAYRGAQWGVRSPPGSMWPLAWGPLFPSPSDVLVHLSKVMGGERGM